LEISETDNHVNCVTVGAIICIASCYDDCGLWCPI